eukprot:SAG31_NODE_9350_length_1291_cov_1.290268_1_plen_99_part_00
MKYLLPVARAGADVSASNSRIAGTRNRKNSLRGAGLAIVGLWTPLGLAWEATEQLACGRAHALSSLLWLINHARRRLIMRLMLGARPRRRPAVALHRY